MNCVSLVIPIFLQRNQLRFNMPVLLANNENLGVNAIVGQVRYKYISQFKTWIPHVTVVEMSYLALDIHYSIRTILLFFF